MLCVICLGGFNNDVKVVTLMALEETQAPLSPVCQAHNSNHCSLSLLPSHWHLCTLGVFPSGFPACVKLALVASEWRWEGRPVNSIQ